MATSPEMTKLLERFGVNYGEAPAPTPALLAFMRGMGVSLDTADATRTTALARLGSTRDESLAGVNKYNERSKESVTADAVRRGVLKSGEANTRYARQAEDVAERRTGVQSAYAQGVENVDSSYSNVRDQLRQQALERTLQTEETQATQKAQSEAQTNALKAQQDAADLAWKRQQEAAEKAIQQQIGIYQTYGA